MKLNSAGNAAGHALLFLALLVCHACAGEQNKGGEFSFLQSVLQKWGLTSDPQNSSYRIRIVDPMGQPLGHVGVFSEDGKKLGQTALDTGYLEFSCSAEIHRVYLSPNGPGDSQLLLKGGWLDLRELVRADRRDRIIGEDGVEEALRVVLGALDTSSVENLRVNEELSEQIDQNPNKVRGEWVEEELSAGQEQNGSLGSQSQAIFTERGDFHVSLARDIFSLGQLKWVDEESIQLFRLFSAAQINDQNSSQNYSLDQNEFPTFLHSDFLQKSLENLQKSWGLSVNGAAGWVAFMPLVQDELSTQEENLNPADGVPAQTASQRAAAFFLHDVLEKAPVESPTQSEMSKMQLNKVKESSENSSKNALQENNFELAQDQSKSSHGFKEPSLPLYLEKLSAAVANGFLQDQMKTYFVQTHLVVSQKKNEHDMQASEAQDHTSEQTLGGVEIFGVSTVKLWEMKWGTTDENGTLSVMIPSALRFEMLRLVHPIFGSAVVALSASTGDSPQKVGFVANQSVDSVSASASASASDRQSELWVRKSFAAKFPSYGLWRYFNGGVLSSQTYAADTAGSISLFTIDKESQTQYNFEHKSLSKNSGSVDLELLDDQGPESKPHMTRRYLARQIPKPRVSFWYDKRVSEPALDRALIQRFKRAFQASFVTAKEIFPVLERTLEDLIGAGSSSARNGLETGRATKDAPLEITNGWSGTHLDPSLDFVLVVRSGYRHLFAQWVNRSGKKVASLSYPYRTDLPPEIFARETYTDLMSHFPDEALGEMRISREFHRSFDEKKKNSQASLTSDQRMKVFFISDPKQLIGKYKIGDRFEVLFPMVKSESEQADFDRDFMRVGEAQVVSARGRENTSMQAPDQDFEGIQGFSLEVDRIQSLPAHLENNLNSSGNKFSNVASEENNVTSEKGDLVLQVLLRRISKDNLSLGERSEASAL